MFNAYGKRAADRCRALGKPPYSESSEYLFRAYLSNEYKQSQHAVAQWMNQAGMTTHIDPAGNLVGRYAGRTKNDPILIIGSHLDTVRNGGCFDGNLGIMLGIEVIDYFNRQQKRFPFAIDVIAFGDEEGSRFPMAMLTSKSVAGVLNTLPQGLKDKKGISIEQAFKDFGLDYRDIQKARYYPENVIGYLEAHIEQGPVLESEGLPLGIVTGIAAQYRFQILIKGQAGHSGTTSMNLRKDAMAGAAEIIYLSEQYVKEAEQEGVVITTGQITVTPGAPNVIAEQVVFSVDLRAPTDEKRNEFAEQFEQIVEKICQKRRLDHEFLIQHDLSASLCDKNLMSLLEQAIQHLKLPVRYLTSGAGHDAMILSHLAPTAMLFIQSPNGISHSPKETVRYEDVTAALQTMIHFIELKEDNI
ncbi:Acetylornithine deacetylase/Succinyl-diaminopimelate desuccinylase or related deacylase (ArgE) (PDB:1CG2) [Commensalibacter communis]|uniref:allantoate amidohydrolase n=1 Tax=Commensalibacter communis TaxID=2972786 RepID=UPI0022FF7DA3|nr:allantoate amidohydrolase [Commensalibacter communis]CAI3955701.1 Acetylornithine deacetylase/Succinyl-diaminopimelate desuccinylase or related deacylase (ArgE) (PDB:1CG2) [Commensalibacter communis]